jgi:hypothetical protein
MTTTNHQPGKFISYNPMRAPKAPEKDGFVAGTYFDGGKLYAGTGKTTQCPGQPIMPARIATSFPAAYMDCLGREMIDYRTASYVQAHADLKWVATNTSKMMNVSNAVVLKGVSYNFFIGRVNLTDLRGKKYQTVSKVHCGNGTNGMFYWSPFKGEVYTTSGFEILTC